jgi:hypothetical protein
MENFSQASFIDNNNVSDDDTVEQSTFHHPLMMPPVSMQKKESELKLCIYLILIFTLDNGPRHHASLFR